MPSGTGSPAKGADLIRRHRVQEFRKGGRGRRRSDDMAPHILILTWQTSWAEVHLTDIRISDMEQVKQFQDSGESAGSAPADCCSPADCVTLLQAVCTWIIRWSRAAC
jgi:hypothetical protein